LKVSSITITFEPDAGESTAPASAHYLASSQQWKITGTLYPRYLRTLIAVAELITGTDRKAEG
jgi:hypothetical protein